MIEELKMMYWDLSSQDVWQRYIHCQCVRTELCWCLDLVSLAIGLCETSIRDQLTIFWTYQSRTLWLIQELAHLKTISLIKVDLAHFGHYGPYRHGWVLNFTAIYAVAHYFLHADLVNSIAFLLAKRVNISIYFIVNCMKLHLIWP